MWGGVFLKQVRYTLAVVYRPSYSIFWILENHHGYNGMVLTIVCSRCLLLLILEDSAVPMWDL